MSRIGIGSIEIRMEGDTVVSVKVGDREFFPLLEGGPGVIEQERQRAKLWEKLRKERADHEMVLRATDMQAYERGEREGRLQVQNKIIDALDLAGRFPPLEPVK